MLNASTAASRFQFIWNNRKVNMDLSSKSINDLENLNTAINREIIARKTGDTKPVYVVDNGDTNSCFKNKEDAIQYLVEEPFNNYGKQSSYIRDVPTADYDLASDRWIEV
jgi:hypothetical protein